MCSPYVLPYMLPYVLPFMLPYVPLATIELVGDNREFEVSGIFWAVIPILGYWYS